jgi:cell division protein ZapB
MSLEVFEKLESKVQQAIDTITLLQMEIEELKEKNNSLAQEVQNAQHSREELERENNQLREWLAGSSAGAAGAYGRSVISFGKCRTGRVRRRRHPAFFITRYPADLRKG